MIEHTAGMIPLGDCAVLVQLGTAVDEATYRKVQLFTEHLDRHPFAGMIEYVPAFTTVAVYYDSLQVYRSYMKRIAANSTEAASMQADVNPYEIVAERLQSMLGLIADAERGTPKIVEIPVCYGGEFGPDLDEVARHNGISVEEVISIHTSGEYLVYMIGFAPGFPYLGGMSSRIAAPRKETPRLAIPGGTVGIAGNQTGVYPIETPGGWQLIGRTPVPLFLPERFPPTLLAAGNVVRFYPISRSDYERWEVSGG